MTASQTQPAQQASPVTDWDEYLFDLRGYLVLENAIDPDHLAELNASLDEFESLDPPLEHGEWYGYVHGHTFGKGEGINLQQIYEAGEPWERLIDNPAWWEKVKHFIGGMDGFDGSYGPPFIDENFASIRGPGDAIGLHSGGHDGCKRTQFRYHNGRFQCGQINILMALTDIGPGDGATMLIPGSHKQNFPHPQSAEAGISNEENTSADGVVEAKEIHMNAGDALLFVDACNHGSAKRLNEGKRRICVYRYGPAWSWFRHRYFPSDEMLARLTPQRRKIVLPKTPMTRQPNRKSNIPDPPGVGE